MSLFAIAGITLGYLIIGFIVSTVMYYFEIEEFQWIGLFLWPAVLVVWGLYKVFDFVGHLTIKVCERIDKSKQR